MNTISTNGSSGKITGRGRRSGIRSGYSLIGVFLHDSCFTHCSHYIIIGCSISGGTVSIGTCSSRNSSKGTGIILALRDDGPKDPVASNIALGRGKNPSELNAASCKSRSGQASGSRSGVCGIDCLVSNKPIGSQVSSDGS
ncbi:hypothetical protein ES703_125737 [subsurface metagenome]